MKILDAPSAPVTTATASAKATAGDRIACALPIIALAALGLLFFPGPASAQSKRAVSDTAGPAASASKIAITSPDSLEALIEKASGSRAEIIPGAGDAVDGNAAAGGVAPAGSSAIDEAFIAARKAMLANNLDRYDQSILSIPRNHVLYSYVEYWRLRILLNSKRLEALTGDADAAARSFIKRYPDTLAADLLRRDWILALGRRGDWPAFDEQYPQWQLRDESSPDCYAHLSTLAKLPAGRELDRKTRTEVQALLMRPVALNRACSDLFDGMTSAGQLQPADIRRRLMLALEANATADIRQSAALLGSALNEKGMDQALNRPAAALKTEQTRDLLLIALTRLARTDPESAAAHLRSAGARLTDDDRRFVWSQIAAAGMRRLAPEAYLWTREAVGAKVSEDTRAWMVRAALREQDWALVRTVILEMSEQERKEPQWIYWLGRARKAEGKAQEAEKLFASLTGRRDFYGKLANEELGRLATKPPRPAQPDPAAIAALDANPGFARALAFYDLGMRFEGNREWNFQLRGRSDAELRAAAHWAMNRGLLDRAINADERIRGEADFALRFPTPFSDQLVPISRQQNLDAAWVYGLIRQESRFIMDARSHVGASGLMQIMPATARWIAKKLGRHDFAQRDLNDLQTNLEFGSFYLKQALDDLDGSAVLASAGYNAGPRRARDWRGTLSRPMEGAIFAEIIPFSETRGYVKSVLSNAADYAAHFSGEPQSLKARLGTIEPRVAGVTQLP